MDNQPKLLTITVGLGEKDGEEVIIFSIKVEDDGTAKVGYIPSKKLQELLQYAPVKEVKHYVEADEPEAEQTK